MPKIASRAVPLVFALVGVLIPLSSAAQAPAERRPVPVQAAPGQTTPNREISTHRRRGATFWTCSGSIRRPSRVS